MRRRIWAPVLIVAAVMAACRNPGFESVDLQALAYSVDDFPPSAGPVDVRAVNEEKDWEYLQWANLRVAGPAGDAVLEADVILFSDKKELLKAYAAFTAPESRKGYAEYDPPEIGYAVVGGRQDRSGGGAEIVFAFQRCYAMASIRARVGGESSLTEEAVYRYAAALDMRLNNSVCPI
ncbi:MAG: hypothetical protein JW929_14820 [Anaerolineales bacterium]|nr:hypothetical protein [Anaerolineales bacterium]